MILRVNILPFGFLHELKFFLENEAFLSCGGIVETPYDGVAGRKFL